MAHPLRSKSRPLPRSRMSFIAKLGRDLEAEARMIMASLWAPLKTGLEAILRFGLRSDISATIMDSSRGSLLGVTPLRPSDGDDRKPAQPRPGPKRFLAARHGDE